MIIVGLTGSIGMGKSTAADMLRAMGVAVIDSDHIARSLTAPGGAALPALRSAFPEVFDGAHLDRAKLSALVFNDARARARVENIIHPMIHTQRTRLLDFYARRKTKLVVLDIPLLFEKGLDALCDYVIVVSAPYDVQRARVLARPGMDEDAFLARLQNQMPDALKRARADFVVDTGRGRGYTARALRRIVKDLTR